ncbi:hypothetical protein FB451DRAFT_1187525 [Mycena latifolia]|nr:hypothetical protein FB451DRAFT_1187525 [Mycena latifolia]
MAKIPSNPLHSSTFHGIEFITTDNAENNTTNFYTRFKFPPALLHATHWGSMFRDPIYPTLVCLMKLVMLVEPALLDDLAFFKFGRYPVIVSGGKYWGLEASLELTVELRRQLIFMVAVEAAAVSTSVQLLGIPIKNAQRVHITCAGWDEDDGYDSDELPELIDSWIDL